MPSLRRPARQHLKHQAGECGLSGRPNGRGTILPIPNGTLLAASRDIRKIWDRVTPASASGSFKMMRVAAGSSLERTPVYTSFRVEYPNHFLAGFLPCCCSFLYPSL